MTKIYFVRSTVGTMIRFNKILLCGLLALFLPACLGLGLQPERGAESERLPVDFPEVYSFYYESNISETGDYDTSWWKAFQNPELNRLMDVALTDNFSVLKAWARIEQAHYKALKANSWFYPELGFGAGAGTQKRKEKGRNSISVDEWSLGFNAAYEVDLWGRVRAVSESEQDKFSASREDLDAALLSVSGAVAETWVDLIENRRHHDLLLEQVKLQKKLLELIILRFPLAQATALDIYQQQQIIEKLRSSLIPTINNQELLLRRLALLSGRILLAGELLKERSFPSVGLLPNLGLPADLLAARPDVKAAGLRLKATEWEVVAARADRLPALRLTASARSFADDPGSIFDNWFYNLAANLAGPVFDSGRRRAEVARVKAVADEYLQSYREVVVSAVIEVEDALTLEKDARETLNSLHLQIKLARQTLREARRRYLNGSGDFINVLKEELNSLQLDHDVISQEKKVLRARINLHKALGGSWPGAFNKESITNVK